MNILFDQGTPVPLRDYLSEHNIDTAFELGWSQLQNGDLLDEAEKSGYDVMVTTDRNLRHQQNLSQRQLTILVLLSTSWPLIQKRIEAIQTALDSVSSGDYIEIAI